MNESQFSAKLQKTILRDAHCQRIETSTASGVPDLNCCLRGVEFWIETKIMTPQQRVLLRPYQWAWIRRRSEAGGLVYVIAASPATNFVYVWSGKNIEVSKKGIYMMIMSVANFVMSPAGNFDSVLSKRSLQS